MKRILLLLLMVTSLAAISQVNNLTTVNTVKPKMGQKLAFEAAYKTHIAKFHQTDQKINVWEVITGTYAGYYHLVESGRSFADFDKVRADAAAHGQDLDKSFFPMLEDTKNATFRLMDSTSYRPEMSADKAFVTVRHIKLSMEADYRREQARSIKVIKNLKGKFWESFSVAVFEQLWDGSDPVVISLRNLKDGFASLAPDFYTPAMGPNDFRDEYVRQFGTADWDKRQKINEDAVASREEYLVKYRKDLSSQ